jgi:hypothetical protein
MALVAPRFLLMARPPRGESSEESLRLTFATRREPYLNKYLYMHVVPVCIYLVQEDRKEKMGDR